MRRIAIVLVVLLVGAPAAAAPTVCVTWKKRQKTIDKQEKAYWAGYRPRLDAMYDAWRTQWGLWRSDPDTYKDEVEDLTVLRDLYGEYVDLQRARTQIDRDLAATGEASAAPVLLGALLDVMKDVDKLEKEHADARPTRHESYYDQEPGIRLHGLAARVEGLVEALAASNGAVAFLGDDGFAKAKRADKTKSVRRRAAVLDALGRTKDAAARPALEAALASHHAGVRIAALENLVPFGASAVAPLGALHGDPSPSVRRALLETITKDAADVTAWISSAMDVYETSDGLLRARALEALVRLTRLDNLGDDPSKWREWWSANRKAVASGSWKPPEKASEDEPVPPTVVPKALTTFYGVGAPSRHLVFVLDGSTELDQPADLETQGKKARRTWRTTTHQWRGLHLDHKSLLLAQLLDTYDAMTSDARFAVVYLWGGTPERAPVLGDKKPLEPSKRTRKTLEKEVGKPLPSGWMSAEEGLRRALGLCGEDPCGKPGDETAILDTVFLLHTGWCGGRFGIPEAVVADFARKNRFRRMQVNAIRITDRKADAESLMKGLAEVSGGTYLWLKQVPGQ